MGRRLCTERHDFSQRPTLAVRGAGDLKDLVASVQGFLPKDRPVLDMTDLSGNFEWALSFSMTTSTAHADSVVPSILTALPEQLGLKLDPRAMALEVLVIESVSMPSPD